MMATLGICISVNIPMCIDISMYIHLSIRIYMRIRIDISFDIPISIEVCIGVGVKITMANIRIAEGYAADRIHADVQQRQQKRQEEDQVVRGEEPCHIHKISPFPMSSI